MKKALNLLTVMLLTLVAGSFLMLGCSNPTDGSPGLPGSIGSPGVATFTGGSPELLEAYFENANIVYLVNGLGAGVYTVPAGKTLGIVGDVTLNNAAINALNGNLDLSDAGVITGNGVLIVAPGVRDDVLLKSGTATVPSYLNLAGGVPETPASGDVVVLELPGEIDSETDLGDIATGTIYVIGDVSVDADTAVVIDDFMALSNLLASGSGGLTMAGGARASVLKASADFTLTAVNGTVYTLDLNGKKVTAAAGSNMNIGTITSGAAGGIAEIGGRNALPSVTVEDTDITVSGTFTSLTLANLYTLKAGKLVLPKEAVTFSVSYVPTSGKIGYSNGSTALASLSLSGNNLILSSPGAITGALVMTGSLTVEGNLAVGSVTAAPSLRVNGNLSADGAIAATSLTVTGTLATADDVTVTSGGNIATLALAAGTSAITFGGNIGSLTLTGAGARTITNGTIEALTINAGTLELTGTTLVDHVLATGFTGKNVTLAGITLGAGGFDGTLGAGERIIVGSGGVAGELIIGGAAGATLDLDDGGTATVTVTPGSKISFAHAASKVVSGTDATKVLLSAAWIDDDDDPVNPSKVAITGTADYTLTGIPTAGTGTGITIVLGTTKYTFTNVAVNDLASAAATTAPDPAIGSITAGARTTLSLKGSS
jgi:hypothetical protein